MTLLYRLCATAVNKGEKVIEYIFMEICRAREKEFLYFKDFSL